MFSRSIFISTYAMTVALMPSGVAAQEFPSLTPSDEDAVTVGTDGPDGETSPLIEFDPESEVTTSTTFVEEDVNVAFTGSADSEDTLYGQRRTSSASAEALVTFSQNTATVVTSTPDGEGGFVVSLPTADEPVLTSTPSASVTSFSLLDRTDITGLRELSAELSEDGDFAEFKVGDVSTQGIFFGTAEFPISFDPDSGDLSLGDPAIFNEVVIDASGVAVRDQDSFVSLDSDGIAIVNGDITLNGQSVSQALADNAADIAAETTARISADEALGERIDTNATSIAANAADIAAETTARTSADEALGERIDTNATSIAANAVLISDNTALIHTVEAESVARDDVLGTRISQESSARAAADEDLLGRLNSEVAARVAADTSLGNRIGAVEGRVISLEGRVDVLEDKVDSSTAVAIAMGGNAFLPDMDFNLSANVATFNGAQAISAAFGARVSKSFAISGAIGHGMNKRGDTGGRIGVIFGF